MNLYEPMTIDGARWSVVRRLERGFSILANRRGVRRVFASEAAAQVAADALNQDADRLKREDYAAACADAETHRGDGF